MNYSDVVPYLIAPGRNEKGWLLDLVEINGLNITILDGSRTDNVRQLRKQIMDYHIQILHTQGFHSNVLGRLAVKLGNMDVKLVNTVHGAYCFSAAKLISKIYFSLDYLSMFLTDRIITVSEATAHQIRWLGLEKRTSTIHNGTVYPVALCSETRYQIRKQLGIPESWNVVCFVGRLSPEKGIKNLYDVICETIKSSLNIAFIIVGDGEMKTILEICQHDFPERVFLLGHQPDVSPFYQASDILLLPSLSEGLPMVALEAFAYGLPLVANNVGGVSEVVIDNFNGILCSRWNSKEISKKMIALLIDNRMKLEFGRNAQKTVENYFTIHDMVSKTYNLYRTLI